MVNAITIGELTRQLSLSMRKPGKKTLVLIDKALSYLTPFESGKAMVSSSYEKRELLELLDTHRLVLAPYLDTDRVEWNLRNRDVSLH